MNSTNTNSGGASLRQLDVNVQGCLQEKNIFLPMPVLLPRGAKRDEYRQQGDVPQRGLGGFPGITAPLTYNELRKGLRDVLLRIEIMCNDSAERRRMVLLNEFSRLLRAASEETKQVLGPLPLNSPLSYQVLYVLHLRRSVLCTGFECTLSELKEWLSLAMLLGESDVLQFMQRYAQGLGPRALQLVNDAVFMHQSSLEPLVHAVLDIPTPEEASSPFNSRYYVTMLDDLIAMGDEPPQPMAFQLMQREVTVHIRETHVEWMLQLSMASNLKLETFFLAVSILERYLLKVSVNRERLQLVCCAALLLASKQEEIFPVPLRALVRHAGERFTLEMLVSAECQIFALLGFDVVYATLSGIGMGLLMQQDPPASEQQRCFVMYILATLAIRTHYMQYMYSSLAAAAVYVSRLCFEIPTGHPCEEVRSLLPFLRAALCRNPGVNPGGVYDIFGRSAFYEVSKIRLPDFP